MAIMGHLKRNMVELRAEMDYRAHALVIAVARVMNNPDYWKNIEGDKRQGSALLMMSCCKRPGSISTKAFQAHL
jgi:hypothetical protein